MLPTYPFQRRRHWVPQPREHTSGVSPSSSSLFRQSWSTLVAGSVSQPTPLDVFVVECDVTSDAAIAALRDHVVLGAVLLPFTGILEMFAAGWRAVRGEIAAKSARPSSGVGSRAPSASPLEGITLRGVEVSAPVVVAAAAAAAVDRERETEQGAAAVPGPGAGSAAAAGRVTVVAQKRVRRSLPGSGLGAGAGSEAEAEAEAAIPGAAAEEEIGRASCRERG